MLTHHLHHQLDVHTSVLPLSIHNDQVTLRDATTLMLATATLSAQRVRLPMCVCEVQVDPPSHRKHHTASNSHGWQPSTATRHLQHAHPVGGKREAACVAAHKGRMPGAPSQSTTLEAAFVQHACSLYSAVCVPCYCSTLHQQRLRLRLWWVTCSQWPQRKSWQPPGQQPDATAAQRELRYMRWHCTVAMPS